MSSIKTLETLASVALVNVCGGVSRGNRSAENEAVRNMCLLPSPAAAKKQYLEMAADQVKPGRLPVVQGGYASTSVDAFGKLCKSAWAKRGL